MSKVKRLSIKNFIGIDEREYDAGKINIFKGPKGSGKSSIIEGLETIFTNNKRRVEVIKHGENESILFTELDNGLEITRKIRTEKADYLNIRKDGEGVPSTEKFLRQFISGEIFRPVDWVNLPVKEQTKSILNMLQIKWSIDDIENWFGELPDKVEFSQHVLMVLKAIETKYYNDREETNRQIRELKSQLDVIKMELPANYNGDDWRDLKVQEYYKLVSDAQKINQYIEQAKALQEGFENKVAAINSDADAQKDRIHLKYRNAGQDIKDIIEILKSKAEKANEFVNNSYKEKTNAIDLLDRQKAEEIRQITLKYLKLGEEKLKEIDAKINEQKDIISLSNNRIEVKQNELTSLDEKELLECESVEKESIQKIENEKIRVGKAAEYLEQTEPIDIEPLQKSADEVVEMQTYIRQYDMFKDIRDNKLASRERYSEELTSRIEKARTLPQNLIKIAQMPIDGISVDEKGLIRIKGTLISDLSDGEKLELAMKIAKAQAGELKVICIDKFESLNKSAQDKLLEEMQEDDYQYFITEVDDTENSNIEIQKM